MRFSGPYPTTPGPVYLASATPQPFFKTSIRGRQKAASGPKTTLMSLPTYDEEDDQGSILQNFISAHTFSDILSSKLGQIATQKQHIFIYLSIMDNKFGF
jgi:hypothetical protein